MTVALRLKEWMQRNGKDSRDVANALSLDYRTVDALLEGKFVRRSTKASIERFIQDSQGSEPHPPKTA